MKIIKRFSGLLLAFVLLAGLLPADALAAPVTYDLKINGVQVTSDNWMDVLQNGTFLYQYNAKTLVIDEIEVLQCGLPDEPTLQIRVVCSKGTYIRALARDIGVALGGGAHLTALRRTRVGNVRVEDCLTLEALVEKLENETYVSPEQAAAERLERERIENRERAAQQKAEREARQQARQRCDAPPKRTSQIK